MISLASPGFDLHPKTRRRLCPVAIVALAAALIATFTAALTGADMLYKVGLIAVIGTGTALVSLRTGINARVLERARQAGYDQGYSDGRRIAKPVIIRSPDAALNLRENLSV